MTKDEALKLALEALGGKYSITASMLKQQFQAITAIKEALAQPAQEPDTNEETVTYVADMLARK
jgi:dTDP-D-glucose 4,6-dehydratase